MNSNETDAQNRVDTIKAQMSEGSRRMLTTVTPYTLTGYSETPSRNGVAWHGIIRKNGTKIGSVTDDGNGGMAHVVIDQPEEADFTATARTLYGTEMEDYALMECFVSDLATAAQYNRKRSVLFITDDSDLSMAECFVLKSSVTLARAQAALTAPGNPHEGKNPMIWDKRTSVFVPAADFTITP
jgi:hypothetical protein